MILAHAAPSGNPADAVSIATTDPRVVAFAALIAAVDAPDPKAGILATRELRRLGYSVCLTSPKGRGGHR